jgi:O-antigen/teichoic acid export membrane protein
VERPAWNLLTGALTKYAFLFVSIGIGIVLMPFTLSHLGKAEYGLWMLVASMTAHFQLLDLGYGNGLVRQVTQADARADENEINTILSTFLVVYGVIGLIALTGVAALVQFVVPRFPNLSREQVVTAQWVLGILGLRVAVGFPMSVFGAVTTARQRFSLTGTIAIAVALLQAAATYAVLSAGYGLVPLVAATTLIALASYLAYGAAARTTFPALTLSVRRFSRVHVREVTSFSLHLFMISIAIQLGTKMDALVIGAFLGTSAIAVYTVAMRLADYQRQLCGQISGLLFPVVVRFHAHDDRAALRTTLLESTRLSVALVAGLTVPMLAFGSQLVQLWMGPGFEESIPALYVLALMGLVIVAQGPTGNILLGAGRHRLVGAVAIVDVACNLALSLFLISRLGIVGVALGSAIPYVILNLAVLVPAACRTLELPFRTFARVALVPALIGTLAAVVAAAVLRAGATPTTLGAVLRQSTAVALVYALAFWFGGLNRVERARYRGAVEHFSAGVGHARVATSG